MKKTMLELILREVRISKIIMESVPFTERARKKRFIKTSFYYTLGGLYMGALWFGDSDELEKIIPRYKVCKWFDSMIDRM